MIDRISVSMYKQKTGLFVDNIPTNNPVNLMMPSY